MSKTGKINILYIIIIISVWLFSSIYTFDKKADRNGDNICYYLIASSMAEGHGYSVPWTGEYEKTSVFPPAYPMIMTPLRMVTDSIVAQKWMNELFVLASLLLLFVILLRLNLPPSVAFVAALSGAALPRLLHFSTMMMSESSFLLTSMLVLFCLMKLSEENIGRFSELKSKWFYLVLLCLVLNYHVRTQGLALMVGVCLFFLINRRWLALGTTVCGFVLGCIPWVVRNKVNGLTNTRYLDMVMMADPWHPEMGSLSVMEFVSRFFEIAEMLIFGAIPKCIPPFVNTYLDATYCDFWSFLAGITIVTLIVMGCIRIGRLGWMVFGYFVATIGIISCFSTPSGSRYITSVLPFLSAMELIGLWWVITLVLNEKWKESVLPALLLIPLLFTAIPDLKEQNQMAKAPYPQEYEDFFEISAMLQKAPANSMVCSRKPQMSHFYSGQPSCGYLYSSNAENVVRGFVKDKVDYVILDDFGFSTTTMYLKPAIEKYQSLFHVLVTKEKTATVLYSFDRDKASELFNVSRLPQ